MILLTGKNSENHIANLTGFVIVKYEQISHLIVHGIDILMSNLYQNIYNKK